MENKIIHTFPLEELNIILGGIRERTIYYFYLVMNETGKPDESMKLINKSSLLKVYDSTLTAISFLNAFALMFGKNRTSETLAVINYLKITEQVKEYFSELEVDMDIIYQYNEDIYKFMDDLNNNPIIDETQRLMNTVAIENGSIIVFNVSGGKGFDELIIAPTPSDYNEVNIMIYTDKTVFDIITPLSNGSLQQYSYPFTGLKHRKFNNIKFINDSKIFKTLNFEVELEDDNPEFIKHMISRYCTFSKRWDILGYKFV